MPLEGRGDPMGRFPQRSQSFQPRHGMDHGLVCTSHVSKSLKDASDHSARHGKWLGRFPMDKRLGRWQGFMIFSN